MKTNVLQSKYHILVVADQSGPSQTAMQNAVNLAKSIDGSIELFYVKPSTSVVRNVNQLSAMRELNGERSQTRRKLRALVDQIAVTERIPIIFDFAFGNVLYEVQEHINKTQPDIVVLEKVNSKVNNLFGLDLASYLLKKFKGTLLIASEDKALRAPNEISLGILDDFQSNENNVLAEDLEKSSRNPVTWFKINGTEVGPGTRSATQSLQNFDKRSNATTFEFEQGANFSNSVSKYVERSGVNLLCVRKSKLMDFNGKQKTVSKHIHKAIQKTDIPILILEN